MIPNVDRRAEIDTALRARKYRVARQKNPKGSLPMSATNKGHIKTGHKTMIYVLSLMRLLSVRTSVSPPVWVHTRPRARARGEFLRPYATASERGPLLPRFIIVSLFVPSYYLSYSLPSCSSSSSASSLPSFVLLARSSAFYRFRRISPHRAGDDRFVTWKK